MSYIVNLLEKLYLKDIKTTKDFIYKDKNIDINNIEKSYEELSNGENKIFDKIDGLKFNGKPIYLNNSLLSEKWRVLFRLVKSSTDDINNHSNYYNKSIISEIQNSIWIEGVKSSRKTVKQALKMNEAKKNDYTTKIIRNYNNALTFIIDNVPDINEKNLHTLYSILSTDIEMGNNELDGYPYRSDHVDIDIGTKKIPGISPDLIKENMDELFKFVNNTIKEEDVFKKIIDSFIAHYVFEVIHPYYDMNGRVGRLFLLWVALKNNTFHLLGRLSESINAFKIKLYNKAFERSNSVKFKNDVTYFVGSLLLSIIANNISIAITSIVSYEYSLKTKNKLNDFEIDILTSLINKDKDKFYKTQEFILGVDEINSAQVSTSLRKLVEANLIHEVNSKPKEYSFVWTKYLLNKINIFTGSKIVKALK
ncbi:MAG: Fic family protein [Mycoplasma sp.]|nr:Fic family protein [Mycoplasma sp.]